MTLSNKHICFMCYRFTMGYGVDLVVAKHVDYFLGNGWKVGVVFFMKDDYYLERYRKEIASGQLSFYALPPNEVRHASELIASIHPSAVILHTPPFFSLLETMPEGIIKIMMDYGEPPAYLFPDREQREKLREDKIVWGTHADKVVSISCFIQKDSGIRNTEVILIGNDHLLKPLDYLDSLKGQIQKRLSSPAAFIVLNITRFHRGERLYKGLGEYLAVKKMLFERHPEVQGRILFVLGGRSSERDLEWARGEGLEALGNLSEDELIAAYLDSHFYLSTSQWEGFNLGLGQALSFGIDCAASDRGAHSELGVFVSNDAGMLAEKIHEAYLRHSQNPTCWQDRLKQARLFPWKDSAARLEKLLNEI